MILAKLATSHCSYPIVEGFGKFGSKRMMLYVGIGDEIFFFVTEFKNQTSHPIYLPPSASIPQDNALGQGLTEHRVSIL